MKRKPKQLTSAQVAKLIGCSKATVNRWAKSLANVGARVGQMNVFEKQDVDTLRRHVRNSPGNPNFGKVEE